MPCPCRCSLSYDLDLDLDLDLRRHNNRHGMVWWSLAHKHHRQCICASLTIPDGVQDKCCKACASQLHCSGSARPKWSSNVFCKAAACWC